MSRAHHFRLVVLMEDLTFHQLEAFVAICRRGTFRAAADQLGLTQPAVSLRIRQLETAVGSVLFQRRGAAVQLTSTGSLLLEYAERGLAVFDELGQRLRDGDPWRSILRLGSSDLFAMTCLPTVLRRLETLHPEVGVRLTVSSSTTLARMLERGELDAALGSNIEPSERIAVEPLGRADLVLVGNGDRPLPRTVTPQALAGRRILINPRPSPIHDAAAGWFREARVPQPTFSTCNSLPVTRELVAAGGGLGILPAVLVAPADDFVVHPVSPRFAPLRLALATSRTLPRPVAALLSTTAKQALRRRGVSTGRSRPS